MRRCKLCRKGKVFCFFCDIIKTDHISFIEADQIPILIHYKQVLCS